MIRPVFKTRIARFGVIAIALASLLSGCGGGATSISSTLPPSGITDQQRAQFVSDTNQRLATLARRDAHADAEAIAAFWASRPEVAATGVSGNTVWARFVDGQSYTIVLNYDQSV